jgi:hypothetical protein
VIGDATNGSTQLDDGARRPNAPIEFVRRLVSLGALSIDVSAAVKRELGRPTPVRVVASRVSAETTLRLGDKKALSITFLDSPP